MATVSPPTPVYIFRGHEAGVNDLVFFNDDQYFVSGDAKGIVQIWKMRTRRAILQWQAHEESCLSVHVYENDKLITQGRDNTIHVWQLLLDNSTPDKHHLYTLIYDSLTFCRLSLAFNDRQDAIIAIPAQADHSAIDIYNLSKRKWVFRDVGKRPIEEGTKSRGICMAIKLFEAGRRVVAAYESGEVTTWALDEEKDLFELVWSVQEQHEPVLDLALDPLQTFAISTSAENAIIKYDLVTGQTKKTTIKKPGLSAVTIRQDGKIFATAGYDGRIRVFSAKSLKPLAILSYHRDSVYSVSFASRLAEGEDHWLMAGSKESRISLWSIY
ncbi:WD40-repeat-containing domain protein [Syncephalastrum racemosum]|uniref:ASTRA-associated protein 1 n=1 Tax=Syncephalastrum racemosum TaxID=13706 RepID=A0A1X2H331_SYNRA|nr:WD40-repeat-containing domain protein [Syncephalastrum racemosum]